MSEKLEKRLGTLLLFTVAFGFAFGTWRALHGGGNDFAVFHHAGWLVLHGHALAIYRDSPDLYLYCPGMAWFFAPFALLSFGWALALWCILKAFLFGGMLRVLIARTNLIAAATGALLLLRPLLIDLQYGQINVVILSLAVIALDRLFTVPVYSRHTVCAWIGLTICACAKLYPGALLLVPFFCRREPDDKNIRGARVSIVLAGGLILALPLLFMPLTDTLALYSQWKGALLGKGMGIETHNQSFAAFLYRTLGGESSQVMMLGMNRVPMGIHLLNTLQIRWLTGIWAIYWFGSQINFAFWAGRRRSFAWGALLIASLTLPSHLLWKPYFVLFIPLVTGLIYRGLVQRRSFILVMTLCLGIFLSVASKDILGLWLASHFESYAGFLWIGVAWIILAKRELIPSRRNSVTQS